MLIERSVPKNTLRRNRKGLGRSGTNFRQGRAFLAWQCILRFE
jgi:hypothetical protein